MKIKREGFTPSLGLFSDVLFNRSKTPRKAYKQQRKYNNVKGCK
jgi:hypothetical protein